MTPKAPRNLSPNINVNKTHVTVRKGFVKDFKKGKTQENNKANLDYSFADLNLIKTENNKSKRILEAQVPNELVESDEDIFVKPSKRIIKKLRRRSFYTPEIFKELNNFKDFYHHIEFFEGSLVKGHKQGFCKIIYENGIYVEGFFRNDVLEGEGMIMLENGFRFKGYFRRNFLEGKGQLQINEEIYDGHYSKGFFKHKKFKITKSNVIMIFDQLLVNERPEGSCRIYFSNNYRLIDC